MKHCLLVLAAALALAISVPASAQYMFIDVNGDQACTSADVLQATTTSVDVWLATNKDILGNTVVCPTGEALTINSYTFILRAPNGGVVYGTWADALGFSINAGGATAGNDFWVGRASGTPLNPGTYKLGSLPVTVSGVNTMIQIVATTSIDPIALTSFGSQCLGSQSDNTLTLPTDWDDVCGTASPTPTTKTTWGKIKDLYR